MQGPKLLGTLWNMAYSVLLAIFIVAAGMVLAASEPLLLPTKETREELHEAQSSRQLNESLNTSANSRKIEFISNCPERPSAIRSGPNVRFNATDNFALQVSNRLLNWQDFPSTGSETMKSTLNTFLEKEREGAISFTADKSEKGEVFEYLKDMYKELALTGFFSDLKETAHTLEKGGDNGWTFSREISTSSVVQGLYRDFAAKDSCEERFSWPFTWTFEKGNGNRSTLNIHAVPVQKKSGNVYQVVHDVLPNWSVLKDLNAEFLKRNGIEPSLRSKNWTDGGLRGSTQLVVFKASDQLFDCSSKYKSSCALHNDALDHRLCTRWGSACRVEDLIEFDGAGNNHSATHIMYTIGRSVSWPGFRNVSVSLDPNIRANISATMGTEAILSTKGAESTALSQGGNANRNYRLTNNYEPPLREEESRQTFLIAVVTWIAEWIGSGPWWNLQVWLFFLRRWFKSGREGSAENRSVEDQGARIFTVNEVGKRSALVLLPVAGYIPIVTGYLSAVQRNTMRVGLLSFGYAMQKYTGVVDPNTIFDRQNSGVSFGYSFVYQEDSGFPSLRREYLAALIPSTLLLAFSVVPVLLACYNVRARIRRGFKFSVRSVTNLVRRSTR